MKPNALKGFITFLCCTVVIVFGSLGSEVSATCPDGSGNCDIPGEYQINSKRALKMSENPQGLLRNIFIGENSGAKNPDDGNRAYGNVFIGRNTGTNMEIGAVNTFIGDKVAENLKYGLHNTYIGAGAGQLATSNPYEPNVYSPSYNTIVGSIAGQYNVGERNTFIGTEAGRYMTTGSYNVAIGLATLADGNWSYNYACPAPQASWDPVTGFGGCTNSWGEGNIHLGAYTGTSSPDLSYTIVLGFDALATDHNQMVVGNSKLGYTAESKITDCAGNSGCTVNDIVFLPSDNCVEGGSVTDPNNGIVSQTLVCIPQGRILESYWGAGVKSTVPNSFTFNATGGYGTDIRGADLILAGGKSTGNSNGGKLIFKTSPAGTSSGTTTNEPVERMIIDSNGNVGIGTPNPGANMDISVDSTTQGAILRLSNVHWENDAAQQIGAIEFYRNENDNGSLVSTKIEAVSRSIGDWDGELAFYTSNGNPASEAMRIDRNGKVGIGTTNPTEILTVSGVIESTSGGIKFPDGTVQTTASVLLGVTNSTNSFYGQDAGNNTTGVSNTFIGQGSGYLNSTGLGNVFLGYQAGYNETSSNKLYIANSSTASPLIYGEFNNGLVRVNGNFYITGNTYMTSDVRNKANIEPIYSSLNKVLGLSGVSYQWKIEDNKGVASENRHYGVIAQDVEKVLPEIVASGADGSKSVAYMELIPVLIEAIKEQQKTIDSQQKTIGDLSRKVNEVESELRLKGNLAMINPNFK